MGDKRRYFYVSEENEFMREAKKVAESKSLDREWPTGVVVVKDGSIIGRGANGSEYHLQHGCERKRLGIATGERYDLCEGCDPKNHGEPRAIRDAGDARGADVYMWGHWWCCEPCRQAMIDAGINKVYLMKGIYERFSQNRNFRAD